MGWIDLRQYLADKVSRDPGQIDEAGKILASSVGYEILIDVINTVILPHVKTVKGIKGIQRLEEILEEGELYRDWEFVYSELWDFDRKNSGRFKRFIVKVLHEKLVSGNGRTGFPIPEVLRELGRHHGLIHDELKIIAVLYLSYSWEEFKPVLRLYRSTKKIKKIAELCEVDTIRYITLVRQGNTLQNRGLVQIQRGRFDMDGVELTPSLLFALDSGDLNLLSAGLFRKRRKARYGVDCFPVPDTDIGFITGVLASNKSVLISGMPGIGKTEFAYSAAESMGKDLKELEIDSSMYTKSLNKPSARDRMIMVKMAARFINTEKEILLIDESDSVLQSASDGFGYFSGSGSYDKGELNILLEELDIPSIWITNSTERIPHSVLRRFGFVYAFPKPDAVFRKRILKENLKISGLEYTEQFIDRMSREYDMTPSSVVSMVHAVSSIVGKSGNNDILETAANRFLFNASRSLSGRDYIKLVSVPETFDPLFTSSSVPPFHIVDGIKRRAEQGKSARLLFEGPPGGGKTEFAVYTAHLLNREAVIKRPSDFLSKYVGETEKNIRRIFFEAENSGSVLILDEADSFFTDRSMAERTWELSQASEFLQELQSYTGILIACTNRMEELDPAIRRRFHQTVTFGFLEKDLIPLLLKKLFPDISFSGRNVDILLNTNDLMISDFAMAADFLSSSDSETPESVIRSILDNAESRNRNREIGFGRV